MPPVGPALLGQRVRTVQPVQGGVEGGQVLLDHVRHPRHRELRQERLARGPHRHHRERLAGGQVVRGHRRDVGDEPVGGVEAVGDVPVPLGLLAPDVRPAAGAPIGVQPLLDPPDQTDVDRVGVAQRVRAEDDGRPALEQGGDDPLPERQRRVVGGGPSAPPGRRVQHGPRRTGRQRLVADLDLLDLRSADDQQAIGRDRHAVGGVALDALLAGDEHLVVGGVPGAEVRGLVGVTVVEPDVGQSAVALEAEVGPTALDVEGGLHRLHHQRVQVAQRAVGPRHHHRRLGQRR